MQFNRRGALAYLGSAAALGVLMSGAAWADGKAEDGLTQAQFSRITRTENSVPGNPEADPKVPITPIHNLGQSEKRDMKQQGHATKAIDGEVWKAETPAERDAHLRRLRENAPAGSTFFIEVPNGHIWLLPPQDAEMAEYLRRYVYSEWRPYEREALPVAVAPDGASHTDTHGTSVVRVIVIEKEP